MQSVGVLLFYIPAGEGEPLILGRANDREVFAGAAAAAIREAEVSARTIQDPVLAAARVEELGRLRRLLSMLVPADKLHKLVM
jgi:hypothetical protein